MTKLNIQKIAKAFQLSAVSKKRAILTNFDFIWDFVQTELPGPSRVDALYIAYALELGAPVVTDDQDMTELAKEFEVPVMPTLKLLKIMHDSNHADLKRLKVLLNTGELLVTVPLICTVI